VKVSSSILRGLTFLFESSDSIFGVFLLFEVWDYLFAYEVNGCSHVGTYG